MIRRKIVFLARINIVVIIFSILLIDLWSVKTKFGLNFTEYAHKYIKEF